MKTVGLLCTIYLVRHGESGANVGKTIQGHTDSPLTEDGIRQAKEVSEALKDVEFDAIYSSDSGRAKRTAEIIRSSRKLDIDASPLLREKLFGKFEGKARTEYMETLKEEFDRFDNHLSLEERWDHKPHQSMESDRELLERVDSYIREIASRHLGEAVLIVSHRYAIRMLLLSLGLGGHKDLKAGALKNGGYVVLESDGIKLSIKRIVGAEKELASNNNG